MTLEDVAIAGHAPVCPEVGPIWAAAPFAKDAFDAGKQAATDAIVYALLQDGFPGPRERRL